VVQTFRLQLQGESLHHNKHPVVDSLSGYIDPRRQRHLPDHGTVELEVHVMANGLNRRQFIKTAALTGAGFWISNHYARGDDAASASEKLNVGIVGITGRGEANIKEMEKEAGNLMNIVALCDINDANLESIGLRYPKAQRYSDYRKMLEQRDIDAVLVATADHSHAWITLASLRSGRHVYCEKPLAHSVEEVRLVTETAAKEKRVTQMGTQIHAGANYRRVVELIQSGAIGPVKEVHVWVDKGWYQDKPPRTGVEVPKQLHWDLWLCANPDRPYSPDYLPFIWRKWWVFGEGTLGDMACHFVDLPTWALGLTRPTRIAAEGPEVHPEWCPKWLIVHYDFPARGNQPPVKLTWYDGGKRPEALLDLKLKREWKSGVLFIGEKGQLLTDYGQHLLLPEDQFKDFKRPEESIPPSQGHHKEWVVACKQGAPTAPLCNFSYSGPLAETVLLGTVAYRTGEALNWDAQNLKATNSRKAEEFIKLEYRKGWKF
jgi:predicted dehydrogenase